jgi:hypothetical protein
VALEGVSLLAPEQPAHEHRGEYGGGSGRCAFKDRLEDVVFDPALLGYIYEAFGQLVAYEVGYPGRHQGDHSLLRRVVHAPPLSDSIPLRWIPAPGATETPRRVTMR